MATPTAITTDIVRMVQEAELCIIDLTGHNANVFYECGRRHETGRPFIQMVARSWEERLPFDVAGIRTVTYDLTTPRAVLASQSALRAFLDGIASGEVNQRSSGASISTVALSLQRIERKLDAFTRVGTVPRQARSAPKDELDLLVMSPKEAWFHCVRSGDLDGAMAQLDRLKRGVEAKEYLSAIGILLAAGQEQAFPRMEGEINSLLDLATAGDLDDSGWDSLGAAVLGLRAYFVNLGRSRDGVRMVEALLSRLGDGQDHAKTRAAIHNMIGMLAWVHDDYEMCIDYTLRAYNLYPHEPAYVYNLLLAYKASKGEDDPAFQLWLDRLQGFAALPQLHQDYLIRHGRSYAREMAENDED